MIDPIETTCLVCKYEFSYEEIVLILIFITMNNKL